jgi:hypothetical protein
MMNSTMSQTIIGLTRKHFHWVIRALTSMPFLAALICTRHKTATKTAKSFMIVVYDG